MDIAMYRVRLFMRDANSALCWSVTNYVQELEMAVMNFSAANVDSTTGIVAG